MSESAHHRYYARLEEIWREACAGKLWGKELNEWRDEQERVARVQLEEDTRLLEEYKKCPVWGMILGGYPGHERAHVGEGRMFYEDASAEADAFNAQREWDREHQWMG